MFPHAVSRLLEKENRYSAKAPREYEKRKS